MGLFDRVASSSFSLLEFSFSHIRGVSQGAIEHTRYSTSEELL